MKIILCCVAALALVTIGSNAFAQRTWLGVPECHAYPSAADILNGLNHPVEVVPELTSCPGQQVFGHLDFSQASWGAQAWGPPPVLDCWVNGSNQSWNDCSISCNLWGDTRGEQLFDMTYQVGQDQFEGNEFAGLWSVQTVTTWERSIYGQSYCWTDWSELIEP